MKPDSSFLPIHERFHSFQGEGVHMGRSAFFIRTYGCPVHCPWCDSAGTWHKDWPPEGGVQYLGVDQLVTEAYESGAEFAVITGGEPTVYDLYELTNLFHARGVLMHLETSGAFPIQGDFDWITLSPKKWKMPLRENYAAADEFKIIVEKPEDVEFYLGRIIENCDIENCDESLPSIWLHPEWSKRNDLVVLDAIITEVKKGGVIRAGWQLHKLYQADQDDPRSQPLVPLGGGVKQ